MLTSSKHPTAADGAVPLLTKLVTVIALALAALVLTKTYLGDLSDITGGLVFIAVTLAWIASLWVITALGPDDDAL